MTDTSSVPPVPTRIYRWWDANGVLLYVGISSRVFRRFEEHIAGSRWTEWATRMEIEPIEPASRDEALRMEADRIRREKPIFNRSAARGWKARQANYYRARGITELVPGDIADAIATLEDMGDRYSDMDDEQADAQIIIDTSWPSDLLDDAGEDADRTDLAWDLMERADALGLSRAEVASLCDVAEYMIPGEDDDATDTVSVALMQRYAREVGLRLRFELVPAGPR